MFTINHQGGMMKNKRGRKLRLTGFDYSEGGAYFVTICSHRGRLFFGRICNKIVILSQVGGIVNFEWLRTEQIREEIHLDEYVVMPNLIHGIVISERIVLDKEMSGGYPVGATSRSPLRSSGPVPESLGAMVAGFKTSVTVKVRKQLGVKNPQVWQ
jgi:hypothetical protein